LTVACHLCNTAHNLVVVPEWRARFEAARKTTIISVIKP
jgi:hypothetical protein